MEIHFRLTTLDDGSIKIDSRVGNDGERWSHLTTKANEHLASLACGDEVLYQLDRLSMPALDGEG